MGFRWGAQTFDERTRVRQTLAGCGAGQRGRKFRGMSVHDRRIVTFLIIAPYKYSYLLTYLLTYLQLIHLNMF